MLRGAERRMIVVRTKNSRMFEEAYFMVRPEAGDRGEDESDMLREANQILEGSLGGMPRERPSSLPLPAPFGLFRGLVWFFLGFLTGGGLSSLLWVLLG